MTAPTKAPTGSVWVLDWQKRYDKGDEAPSIFGVFSDRAKIIELIVDGGISSIENIQHRNIHWHQGVYNTNIFEGWEEGESTTDEYVWSLSLYQIDDVG